MEPGVVYFGETVDHDTLAISDPQTTFSGKGWIWFAFQTVEPFGARTLDWQVIRHIGGSERVTYTFEENVDPSWHHTAARIRLGALARKPGDYTLQFYTGETLIAEGTFTRS
jgi:hypothetical protein